MFDTFTRSKSFKSAGKTGSEKPCSGMRNTPAQERRRLPQARCRRICESRSRSFRKIIKGRYARDNLSRQLQDSNFQVQGHPLVGFGATKNPCSFFVTSSSMIPKLGTRARDGELKGYNVSGATIHFTADKPLPSRTCDEAR
jgi:hypothetical protein